MIEPRLILCLLMTVAFSCASVIERQRQQAHPEGASDRTVLTALLGDAQNLFANHFFAKADAYFHSGYYPSIFDQHKPDESEHMTEEASALPSTNHVSEPKHQHEHDEDQGYGFLGPPRDWIEALGRNFFPSHHTHLGGGDERELLPWLRLSAELDPHKIQTYTLTAYWLRSRLGKPKEAEKFLREGLRANPDSYEILSELGQIFDENYKDVEHAETFYSLAERKWEQQRTAGANPNELAYHKTLALHAHLEESLGHFREAIACWQKARTVSTSPEIIDTRIQELRAKLDNPKPAN